MSAIGEYREFCRQLEELKKLRNAARTQEEIEDLEAEIEWLEQEAKVIYAEAYWECEDSYWECVD